MTSFRSSRLLRPLLISTIAGFGFIGLGLYVGGAIAFLCVAVVGVGSVVVITRVTVLQVALLSATASALTAPWNAVLIASVRPSDALLVLSLGCFLAVGIDRRLITLPSWLIQLAAVILALTILHEAFPTSPTYLTGRDVFDGLGRPVPEAFTNLGIAGRWLVSLLGIPLMVGFAVGRRRDAARWIAMAYVAGAAVSGFVALADGLGVTAISPIFIAPGGRQTGLTLQPNHLAAAAALALPICVWLIVQQERRSPIYGASCLTGIIIGLYESGSRGGAGASVFAVVLSLTLMRRLRRKMPLVFSGVISLTLAAVVALPALASQVARTTRLSGNAAGVASSNNARELLATQALHDFVHSPLSGIGLQVTLDAHSIYLQLLAAGGVLLLSSMLIFVVGALRTALYMESADECSVALLVSLLAWLAFGTVENGLTDRYLYFPVALIVALSTRSRLYEGRVGPDPLLVPAKSPRRSTPPVLISLLGR